MINHSEIQELFTIYAEAREAQVLASTAKVAAFASLPKVPEVHTSDAQQVVVAEMQRIVTYYQNSWDRLTNDADRAARLAEENLTEALKEDHPRAKWQVSWPGFTTRFVVSLSSVGQSLRVERSKLED